MPNPPSLPTQTAQRRPAWTLEAIRAEAAQHETLSAFRRAAPGAYQAAQRAGLLQTLPLSRGKAASFEWPVTRALALLLQAREFPAAFERTHRNAQQEPDYTTEVARARRVASPMTPEESLLITSNPWAYLSMHRQGVLSIYHAAASAGVAAIQGVSVWAQVHEWLHGHARADPLIPPAGAALRETLTHALHTLTWPVFVAEVLKLHNNTALSVPARHMSSIAVCVAPPDMQARYHREQQTEAAALDNLAAQETEAARARGELDPL